MSRLSSLLLLLLIATPFLASAASFSMNPTADAFVSTGPSGNLSGNNYGGGGAISVSAPGLPQGEFQSVLKFDSSGAVPLVRQRVRRAGSGASSR